MPRSPLVFIPNRGPHDYSDAERYGELVFLTQGVVRRYAVDSMAQELAEGLQDAEPEDHLVASSLPILISIASAILARRFGRVNFLLFRDGQYIERSLDVDALIT